MFCFYVRFLFIIFCLLLGSAKAAMQDDATIPHHKQPGAKIELLIKAMQAQGFSEKQILEHLQKIKNSSGKKRKVCLILGIATVGIVLAGTIYFLIKKVHELKKELNSTNITVSDKNETLNLKTSEIQKLEESLQSNQKILEDTQQQLHVAKIKLSWTDTSHEQFKTVYVTNAAAELNARTLGFITVMLNKEQLATLGIKS